MVTTEPQSTLVGTRIIEFKTEDFMSAGTKNSITRITQTWQNIALLCEFGVNRGRDDFHIRMRA
jgi:3-deoxy-D-manno-octulosonic acid (KDO) 8-phosphate synthase